MNRLVLFNVYTSFCFFCPDVKRADSSVVMSPEQGVFGFGSVDLLAGEEEDDTFNP